MTFVIQVSGIGLGFHSERIEADSVREALDTVLPSFDTEFYLAVKDGAEVHITIFEDV